MIIGLKCYLSLALTFDILTFSDNLLLSEILIFFIKVLSKSEVLNVCKLYAYKKKVCYLYVEVEENVNLRGVFFPNRAYLRHFAEEIFAKCYFSSKFADFNFAN